MHEIKWNELNIKRYIYKYNLLELKWKWKKKKQQKQNIRASIYHIFIWYYIICCFSLLSANKCVLKWAKNSHTTISIQLQQLQTTSQQQMMQTSLWSIQIQTGGWYLYRSGHKIWSHSHNSNLAKNSHFSCI